MIPIPKLPFPNNWWDKLINLGKKVWNLLFQDESRELGSEAAVSKNSTADDIAQIHGLLTQARKKVETETRKMDHQLSEMIVDFAESLRFAADLDNPIFIAYPVNFCYFDRLLNDIPQRMKCVVRDAVSRSVSLDSPDFYEAMRMMPGPGKEQRISELLHKAIESGLNTAVETADNLFREVVEEYDDAISDAISRAVLSSEAVSTQLGHLVSSAEDSGIAAERVIANAESVRQAALLTDIVLNLKEVS